MNHSTLCKNERIHLVYEKWHFFNTLHFFIVYYCKVDYTNAKEKFHFKCSNYTFTKYFGETDLDIFY